MEALYEYSTERLIARRSTGNKSLSLKNLSDIDLWAHNWTWSTLRLTGTPKQDIFFVVKPWEPPKRLPPTD